MTCLRLLTLAASALAFAARSGFAAEPPAADAAFFRTKIQPILTDHCYKCHSHSSDKIKGGLVLDSLSGLITGGDTGPAIVPGDPEKSLLIEAVRYANDDLQMPPKGKKLTTEEIGLLEKWVQQGALWPGSDAPKSGIRAKGKITDEDRRWWSFLPVGKGSPPEVDDHGWSQNGVDRFIFAKLHAEGLQPAPRAEKGILIRRVYFDLVGLPPTPEEIDAFLNDTTPNAYAKLVDKLLASPRYGEHWARHWLDLVRYAESDGYRVDDYRPNAWHYRDYVIRAFNSDKPYSRFVTEQLAGDETAPDDVDARIATGYLRHGIYEYNNRDVVGQWTTILNDLTDVTGDVFLGLGIQCARCHDHKFDPILQKDYYRLQAFFAPILPREDLKLATAKEEADYQVTLGQWEAETVDLRKQIADIEAPHKRQAARDAIEKFPPETQAMIRKPVADRTPLEHQLAELAYRQVDYEFERLVNKMKGPDKEKLVALYKQLSAFDKDKPTPPPQALSATDVGPIAPPVKIPKKKDEDILPGYLTLFAEEPAEIVPPLPNTTGRRAALARWLIDPENPLTTRVIANRIWQYHFGRGLVATSSDFGKLGEPPSHPELLDWLAREFVRQGWSFKEMHRLVLNSATYQQATTNPAAERAQLKDPENRLLWRGQTRRLDAEQIRDAILAATGELDLKEGGPSVDSTKPRRTIYTKVIRNTRDPLLDVFDAPEGFASTSQRNVTTTPTQSLLMINSPWAIQRAKAFADHLREVASVEEERVAAAFQLTFGRAPNASERATVTNFLSSQQKVLGVEKPAGLAAPFVAEKMPYRDGHAAVLIPGSVQERLKVPNSPSLPKADFTVEAFVVLKSLYDDGQVRTVASKWDGNKGHPGWALGVTSKQSRYKPQTVVLLLSGDQAWSDKDPVEPVFSGLHIELGKPYFLAVAVNLGDSTDKGITFYVKDLSNDDEPMQSVGVSHKVTSGIKSDAPFVIGGRGDDRKHLFDGVIDDVRLSTIPLPPDRLLVTSEVASEHTAGYWKFEAEPGVIKDSAPLGNDIVAKAIDAPPVDINAAALVDFCHVLLNSNEFLYVD